MEIKSINIARDHRKRWGIMFDCMSNIISGHYRPGNRGKNALAGAFKNEKGMILLTVLILMFIATLLGIIALNSTTVELQITGYDKRVSTAFESAEGGNRIGQMLIERTHDEGAVPDDMGFTINTSLYNEIIYKQLEIAPDRVDVETSIGGASVAIDIDYLYDVALPGRATGFAMGYEGLGTGSSLGDDAVFYRLRSSAVE
ncbi:MAG: pilus assembly PilX N-terminal domain-containing protein [Deltaproteobacteria bacterium]|nr:pilus assembly PilX N-terminal domain-containing protein [Deltaproteobacteria bacterium]